MNMRNYNNFLLERNLIKKIKKFANIPEIYNWAHETNEDLSIWLANILIDKVKKKLGEKNVSKFIKNFEEKSNNTFEETFFKILEKEKKNITRVITPVIHYVNSPIHSKKPNINKLTLKEALKKSEEWHKELEKTAGKIIENETGKVILTFKDGFYWIDLETTSCVDSAKSMGHCGNTNEGTTLLELRDVKKKSHITIAYNENDDKFTQIKGKGNTRPIDKYHKYIVDIIIELDVKDFQSEYSNSSDFHVEDLSDELYDYLEENAPEYIKNDQVMSDSEVLIKYKNYLENNWEEYLMYGNGDFWDFISDNYLEEFIKSESIYLEENLRDYYTTSDIIGWINEEIYMNNESKDIIIKKLIEYVNNVYDVENELSEKITDIENDFESFLEWEDLDFDFLIDIFENISDLSSKIEILTRNSFTKPEDVFSQNVDVPYGNLTQKQIDPLIPYIDEEKYVNHLMRLEKMSMSIEDMREILNL